MALQEFEQLVTDSEQAILRCKNLSQKVATYSKRLTGESDALAVEVKSLQATISALQTSAQKLEDQGERNEVLQLTAQAKEVLYGVGPGGDLRVLCQPKNPWLLRLLLGDKTNVVTLRREQCFKMKEEYHRFRDNAVLVMGGAPLLLLIGLHRGTARTERGEKYSFTPLLMTGVQVYLAWLSYFYLAMSLRENVLLVNGSAIRSWWIHHHYWSAAASLFMLGLPVHSPAVYSFCVHFLWWSVFQALVMWLQNYYQRRRMYTRIALGKNSAMDVVSGESSGGSGTLRLLYPLLFALQGSQLLIGVVAAAHQWPAVWLAEGWLDPEEGASDLRGRRGVFGVCVLFAFMAVMNFINTLATIHEKAGAKQTRRPRTKSQSQLTITKAG